MGGLSALLTELTGEQLEEWSSFLLRLGRQGSGLVLAPLLTQVGVAYWLTGSKAPVLALAPELRALLEPQLVEARRQVRGQRGA